MLKIHFCIRWFFKEEAKTKNDLVDYSNFWKDVFRECWCLVSWYQEILYTPYPWSLQWHGTATVRSHLHLLPIPLHLSPPLWSIGLWSVLAYLTFPKATHFSQCAPQNLISNNLTLGLLCSVWASMSKQQNCNQEISSGLSTPGITQDHLGRHTLCSFQTLGGPNTSPSS